MEKADGAMERRIGRRALLFGLSLGASAAAKPQAKLSRENLLLYRDRAGSVRSVQTIRQWL